MELASSPPPNKEPWTAAVAWARPWHRPAGSRRPAPAAAQRVVRSSACESVTGVAGERGSDPAREIAWTVALIELRAAELALGEVLRRAPADAPFGHGIDEWPDLMARHAVLRARQRLRQAQEALMGAPADLPWSTS
jgi:hypothetical protein